MSSAIFGNVKLNYLMSRQFEYSESLGHLRNVPDKWQQRIMIVRQRCEIADREKEKKRKAQ